MFVFFVCLFVCFTTMEREGERSREGERDKEERREGEREGRETEKKRIYSSLEPSEGEWSCQSLDYSYPT